MYCHVRTSLILVVASSLLSSTATVHAIDYNDNCDSGEQGGSWFSTCPPLVNDETNWDGNVFPGPGDNVFIAPSFGPVRVDGTAALATVQSVDAGGGLLLTSSAWGLSLTSGGSSITGLVLTNNADIRAGAGVVVTLSGSTTLGAEIHGPGSFVNNGTMTLNAGKLRSGALLINASSAVLSASIFNLFDTGTIFLNTGILDLNGSASAIQGSLGILINEGTLTSTRPDTDTFIDPNYIHQGFLTVNSGTLVMRGTSQSYESGTLQVQTGAVLEHVSPFGGTPSLRYDGLSQVFGNGLVDVREDFTVAQSVTLACGSGDAATGVGGYQLRATLMLDNNKFVTNSGRFRFRGGGIENNGVFGFFHNDPGAWAYTGSSGSGSIIGTTFVNNGNFQLGGGPLEIVLPGCFINSATFSILAGYVTGNGFLSNEGLVHMSAPDPATVSTISVPFGNGEFMTVGTVLVDSGQLRFNNLPLDFDNGTLTGGIWIAQSPGSIRFPATVTRLSSGVTLKGRKSSFPNVDFDVLEIASNFETDDWQRSGDLENNGSHTLVQSGGGGLDVSGTLENSNGGVIELEPGSTLSAGQLDNGAAADPPSVVSKLGGTGPPPKLRTGVPPVAATVVTTLLNNRGRIDPGGAGATAVLQLTGDLMQFPSGELVVDWEGSVPGLSHDQLAIDGSATLDGVVEVGAFNGFVPTLGQQLTILTTTGTITGSFTGVNATDANGYALQVNANTVVLTVTSVGAVTAESVSPRVAGTRVFPNPLSPRTTISFTVAEAGRTHLAVYDVSGQLVRVLVDEMRAPGEYSAVWDGRAADGGPMATGVYFYRLETMAGVQSGKMTLVR